MPRRAPSPGGGCVAIRQPPPRPVPGPHGARPRPARPRLPRSPARARRPGVGVHRRVRGRLEALPRSRSSSGRPRAAHSRAAGARWRRRARPTASSASHAASRGQAVTGPRSDLEVVSVARQQPPGHQRLDDLLREHRRDADEGELRDGDASRAQRPLVVLLREADQQPASDPLALGRERRVRRLGGACSRAGDPARGQVAREREPPVPPRSQVSASAVDSSGSAPVTPQHRTHGDTSVRSGSTVSPGRPRRLLDDLPQLGLGQGRHPHQAACRCSGDLRVLGQPDQSSPDGEHRAERPPSASRPSACRGRRSRRLGDVCRPQLLRDGEHERDQRRRRLFGGWWARLSTGRAAWHDHRRLHPALRFGSQTAGTAADDGPRGATVVDQRGRRCARQPVAAGTPAPSAASSPGQPLVGASGDADVHARLRAPRSACEVIWPRMCFSSSLRPGRQPTPSLLVQHGRARGGIASRASAWRRGVAGRMQRAPTLVRGCSLTSRHEPARPRRGGRGRVPPPQGCASGRWRESPQLRSSSRSGACGQWPTARRRVQRLRSGPSAPAASPADSSPGPGRRGRRRRRVRLRAPAPTRIGRAGGRWQASGEPVMRLRAVRDRTTRS